MTHPHVRPVASDDAIDLLNDGAYQATVGDEVQVERADLYYMAADLFELASRKPPQQASELMALSDVIAVFAAKWR